MWGFHPLRGTVQLFQSSLNVLHKKGSVIGYSCFQHALRTISQSGKKINITKSPSLSSRLQVYIPLRTGPRHHPTLRAEMSETAGKVTTLIICLLTCLLTHDRKRSHLPRKT